MSNYLNVAILARSTVATVLVSSLAIATAAWTLQGHLIYPANLPAGSRENVATPLEHGMNYEDLDLVTPDNVKIKAYLILHSELTLSGAPRPIILVLHANAGNIGHRMPIIKVFHQLGFNVLALSYRGYGKSEGKPSEKGLNLDSQTALDFILSDPRTEKLDIFLYGQSIGGAVAIELAAQNAQRIRGVILENTFTSLRKLVLVLMPYLAPFLFLLHQEWPSLRRVSEYPSALNVLFLSGSKDELIPPSQMKELYDSCTAKKEFISFKDGTHNDTCAQPGYFAAIGRFVTSLIPIPDTIDSEEIPSSMNSSFEMVSKPDAVSKVDIEGALKEVLKEKTEKL